MMSLKRWAYIGGSDVEDGDNSDDASGGGDDNTVDDNEGDGSLVVLKLKLVETSFSNILFFKVIL